MNLIERPVEMTRAIILESMVPGTRVKKSVKI
jgi:hypothetical protein